MAEITTVDFENSNASEDKPKYSADKSFMEDVLPLRDIMVTEELESVSSKIILDDNGMRIRPLIAYDQDRLILQRWDGATGYIDELLLYEKGKPDLTNIFVREKTRDSISPYLPRLEDIKNEDFYFLVLRENGDELVYKYNLKTESLLNVDQESVNEIKSNEEIYTVLENHQDTEFPWIVNDKKITQSYISPDSYFERGK